MTRVINIVTIKDIKEFVNVARDYGDDIIVKSGQYAVPACSLMGLMSIDLSKPVKISFPDEIENRVDNDFGTWISGD